LLFALYINGTCGFSVSGNQILNAAGQQVILRGVDRDSFEWNPAGQYAGLSDYQLMAGWGANVVRLALNQDFWLAGSATYASGYVSTITQQVNWIKQSGMAVILDLHWSDQGNLQISAAAQQCMADVNSVTFWKQVAAHFANDSEILFELYNEPNTISWSHWLSGSNGQNNECGFVNVGMQDLYNAVRSAGATNVVIAGGLNWAFDLSGVAANPISGYNIAYATHPYDTSDRQSGAWPAAFGYLAATHPVIATEFGQYCNSDGYVVSLLAYMNGLNMHWSAWAWWVSGCNYPSIITDWNGTPDPTVGVPIQTALRANAAATTKSGTVAAAATATTTHSTTGATATTTHSTTAATATTTHSTTGAAATTSSSSSSGSSTTTTVTLIINSGDNAYYFAINDPVGGVVGTVSSLSIKDSSSNAVWQVGTVATWGYTWAPHVALVPPLSVQITNTAGQSATLTNVIATVTNTATITVTVTGVTFK